MKENNFLEYLKLLELFFSKENKEDIPVHKELSREEKSKILKNKIEAKQKERLNN